MAEKLRMQSSDIIEENISFIESRFPNAIVEAYDDEGKLVKKVDFDILKQELSHVLVSDKQERYQMTWPDKKKSILLANSSITGTLRPCKEESVDFDKTQNLYIEGDNLPVLKILRETYLNKIKMIYIDPPYNTGTNLIYKNDFSISGEEYSVMNGDYDELGNKLVMNTESNGRFHTDWLNIMYPALKVSKDLLTEDGFIVIAIDDNEVFNLKKIVDEIYGESNFIGTIVTRCNPQGRGKNNIDPVHEYHLIYAKNANSMPLLKIKKENSAKEYGYLLRSGTNSRKYERPYRFYPMLVKEDKVFSISKEEYEKIYSQRKCFDDEFLLQLKIKYESLGYKFILPISKDGEEKVWQREYERTSKECDTYIFEKGQIKVPSEEYRTPTSLWSDEKYSNVAYGANKLKELFNTSKSPFDFSKSIYTMMDLISMNTTNNDIIIDFFPGSGTTGHAVMNLNALDGFKRRFILIQLPEQCDRKSDGYALGYRTIPEIARNRLKLAGEKLNADTCLMAETLDTGFRVLKLDSSNMKNVYYNPKEAVPSLLAEDIDNVKEDRTSLDLLFQVMLELGVELSAKIEEKQVGDSTIYIVNESYFVACFDKDVNDEVVKTMANIKPVYIVLRDASFSNDSANINCEQTIKIISPSTELKVI